MRKRLLLVILALVIIATLPSCSNSDDENVDLLKKEISSLKDENATLKDKLKKAEEEKNKLKKALDIEIDKNNELSKIIDTKTKGITYIDTLVEGKETFTTYKNILINFGSPQRVVNIIDTHNIYNHGRFAILVYDGIEFVVGCSGDSDNPFAIKNNDMVYRVDITSDKYLLNRRYFNNIKVGSSGLEVAEKYNKEIKNINYSEDGYSNNMEIVIRQLRTDYKDYDYKRGIYFSGEMDTGLELGIVFLLDDNGQIARIIMGLPTAG